jgi:spermidine synthase
MGARHIHGSLFFLIFLSGAAALIYELVWARLLHTAFGVSSIAVATVVAVFMLGIALGSLLFGKLAENRASLRLYASLEIAIALLSLISFLVLQHTTFIASLHTLLYNGGFYTVTLGRALLASLILLPPAICIGGTIPVLNKCLLTNDKTLGSSFCRIYAWNTLGAVLGTLLTGFILIRLLGVTFTFLIATLLNLSIAIAIYTYPHTSVKQTKMKAATGDKRMLPFLFLTGFLSLAHEMLLVHIFSIYGDATTYSFTIILTGFLTGTACGSFLMSKGIDRVERPKTVFFRLLLTTALLIPLSILLFQHLQTSSLTGELLLGFSISFLFSTGFGLLFPLGLRLYAGSKRTIGIKTGKVYFWNTIGAILGTLLAGFVLIPFLGIKGGAVALTLLAVITAAFFTKNQKPYFTLLIVAIIAGSMLSLTTGVFFIPKESDDRLIYYQEGLSGTVTVIEYDQDGQQYRELSVDGNGVAGNSYSMTIDSKLLAHLPLLLHPEPRVVGTVGYGTGGTSYSMLLHGAEVYAMEIEEEVVEASALFPGLSTGTLEHERFNLVLDDARNYLSATEQEFDVIVTDVTNLKYKGNPSLYTVDYFQLMEERLTPSGVAAAWIPLSGLSFRDLRIVIASFHEAYPHSTGWFYSEGMTHFLILVGTRERLDVDLDSIKSRISANKALREDLNLIDVQNETVLASMLLLGEEDIRRLSTGMPLHTDEHPVLEYSDISAYMQQELGANLRQLFAFQEENLSSYFPEAQEVGEHIARVHNMHKQVLR